MSFHSFDLASHVSDRLYLNSYTRQRAREKNRTFLDTRFCFADLDSSPTLLDLNDEQSWFAMGGDDTAPVLKNRVQDTMITTHSGHLPPELRHNAGHRKLTSESGVTDVEELPVRDKAIRLIPYISAVGARPSGDPDQPWLIDLYTPNRNPNPPVVTPAFDPFGRPMSEAQLLSDFSSTLATRGGLVPSKSPETLRFWSADLERDIYCVAPRRIWQGLGGNACHVGLTAEIVKSRWKVLYDWARKRGYWAGAD